LLKTATRLALNIAGAVILVNEIAYLQDYGCIFRIIKRKPKFNINFTP